MGYYDTPEMKKEFSEQFKRGASQGYQHASEGYQRYIQYHRDLAAPLEPYSRGYVQGFDLYLAELKREA